MDKKDLKQSKKHVPSFKMPFTPKSLLKGNLKYERNFYLDVSSWKEMKERIHPKRRVLVYNFLGDREAAMLYSPTGVGKTWKKLSWKGSKVMVTRLIDACFDSNHQL